MEIAPVDKTELNEYGLLELPFVISDPENTRYVVKFAQFAYIKDDSVTGFIVFHDRQRQLIIHYLAFDNNVSVSKAEEFIKEFCSQKEVYAITYDCNVACKAFENLGFSTELGLQYMEISHLPDFKLSYGFEYVPILTAKIPSKISALYNKCFSADDGKETMEEFVRDPFSQTGTTFILRSGGKDLGFWVDVTYFEDLCFDLWIGIVPEQRRKGHGSHLMEYALNRAREKGCTRAGLLVNPANESAVKFYEHTGFQKKWGRVHFQND